MDSSKTIRLGLLVFAVLVLVFVFSVADAGHDEPRLIVIGDSMSTTHESWPNFLRYLAPRWNIHLMAQNGRTIRDFSLPRDLWTPGDRNETVIYFLGTNDMLQRNDIGHARYRLRSHISFLLDRNFKVLLIVPPYLGAFQESHGRWMEEHRELIKGFRGTHPNLWVYDMEQVWDDDQQKCVAAE